jgi:hypothetical protein
VTREVTAAAPRRATVSGLVAMKGPSFSAGLVTTKEPKSAKVPSSGLRTRTT